MRSTLRALALACLAAAPAAASGQIAPDTPRMLGPSTPAGLGIHWLRAGTLPGDADAVLVTWNAPGLAPAFRLRGGAGKGVGGETAGFGGIDVRAPIRGGSADRGVDLAWTTGAGVGVGEYVLVSVPLGVAAGAEWSSGSVWLAPYVSLGVALDLRLGDEAPDEEFDASIAADLGLDLALDADRRFVVRAATSLGDRQAVAVGLLVRTGRR